MLLVCCWALVDCQTAVYHLLSDLLLCCRHSALAGVRRHQQNLCWRKLSLHARLFLSARLDVQFFSRYHFKPFKFDNASRVIRFSPALFAHRKSSSVFFVHAVPTTICQPLSALLTAKTASLVPDPTSKCVALEQFLVSYQHVLYYPIMLLVARYNLILQSFLLVRQSCLIFKTRSDCRRILTHVSVLLFCAVILLACDRLRDRGDGDDDAAAVHEFQARCVHARSGLDGALRILWSVFASFVFHCNSHHCFLSCCSHALDPNVGPDLPDCVFLLANHRPGIARWQLGLFLLADLAGFASLAAA